jgi:hypothetical protein
VRYVTQWRLDHLQTLLRSIEDRHIQSEAVHLLESIKRDIEENYAEIQRPIRLQEP